MTFLIHTAKAEASVRAYCGMWIVDCGICKNAWQVDRFQPAWECGYCGCRYEVRWPAERTTFEIERLLLMRPIAYTQNWNPGETLQDLMRENAEHGVFDGLKTLEMGSGQSLLIIDDDGIRADRLPVTRRRELKQVSS